MPALFFGPADRQLFGVHHTPASTARGAVVVCPSWGREYQCAHRALRTLARKLAERGFHVLRFDPSGVGDSWGETHDAGLDEWETDVELAIDELRSRAEVRSVDVIGLRVGARMAAGGVANRSDVDRLVLWDPVLHGMAWVRETDSSRRTSHSGTIEFAQRLISSELLKELEQISPASYEVPGVRATLMLQTQPSENDALPEPDSMRNVQSRYVPDVAPWLEDMSIWAGKVPVRAVQTITDWLVSGD